VRLEDIWTVARAEAMHYLLRRRTNSPFISGDVFGSQADAAVFSPHLKNNTERSSDIRNSNVIFCPGDRLEEFVSSYSRSFHGQVLILGNSDRDYSDESELTIRGISHVYAQNLLFASDTASVIPIGLENLRLARNGLKSLYSGRYLEARKTNNLLVGPFSPTHPDRVALKANLNQMNKESWFVSPPDLKEPKEYALLAKTFRLIAAPRGNGQDTHRFWEALYRGSYPVVTDSVWAEQISHLKVPFVKLANWSQDEIKTLRQHPEVNFDPATIPALWWPFWKREISEKVARGKHS